MTASTGSAMNWYRYTARQSYNDAYLTIVHSPDRLTP